MTGDGYVLYINGPREGEVDFVVNLNTWIWNGGHNYWVDVDAPIADTEDGHLLFEASIHDPIQTFANEMEKACGIHHETDSPKG